MSIPQRRMTKLNICIRLCAVAVFGFLLGATMHSLDRHDTLSSLAVRSGALPAEPLRLILVLGLLSTCCFTLATTHVHHYFGHAGGVLAAEVVVMLLANCFGWHKADRPFHNFWQEYRLVAPIAIALSLLVLWLMRRAVPLSTAGYCHSCGYPLRGLRNSICPECGETFVQPEQNVL
jgi:hypothetical protein